MSVNIIARQRIWMKACTTAIPHMVVLYAYML